MTQTILIMAGGTGGHVFPALAVARELVARGFRIHWLGAEGGIEQRLVPEAGYPLKSLSVRGLRGGGKARLVKAPLMLAGTVWRAWRFIRELRPVLALGFGGFASGPGGLAARCAGVPLVLHEQNAVPGLTNRVLRRFASRVLAAFPDAFAKGAAEMVGNPVRREIVELPAPEQRYAGRQGPLRVLVTGGSQGALALNRELPRYLGEALPGALDIRHQAGRGRVDEALEVYRQAGVDARVEEFIDDMAAAWAWADLVICRAGALTVWEVAAAGVAALFVPLPTAVDDHQSANARWLADQDAARLLPQSQLNQQGLRQALAGLGERQTLAAMAARAREQAIPDSAARVAAICEEVLRD